MLSFDEFASIISRYGQNKDEIDVISNFISNTDQKIVLEYCCDIFKLQSITETGTTFAIILLVNKFKDPLISESIWRDASVEFKSILIESVFKVFSKGDLGLTQTASYALALIAKDNRVFDCPNFYYHLKTLLDSEDKNQRFGGYNVLHDILIINSTKSFIKLYRYNYDLIRFIVAIFPGVLDSDIEDFRIIGYKILKETVKYKFTECHNDLYNCILSAILKSFNEVSGYTIREAYKFIRRFIISRSKVNQDDFLSHLLGLVIRDFSSDDIFRRCGSLSSWKAFVRAEYSMNKSSPRIELYVDNVFKPILENLAIVDDDSNSQDTIVSKVSISYKAYKALKVTVLACPDHLANDVIYYFFDSVQKTAFNIRAAGLLALCSVISLPFNLKMSNLDKFRHQDDKKNKEDDERVNKTELIVNSLIEEKLILIFDTLCATLLDQTSYRVRSLSIKAMKIILTKSHKKFIQNTFLEKYYCNIIQFIYSGIESNCKKTSIDSLELIQYLCSASSHKEFDEACFDSLTDACFQIITNFIEESDYVSAANDAMNYVCLYSRKLPESFLQRLLEFFNKLEDYSNIEIKNIVQSNIISILGYFIKLDNIGLDFKEQLLRQTLEFYNNHKDSTAIMNEVLIFTSTSVLKHQEFSAICFDFISHCIENFMHLDLSSNINTDILSSIAQSLSLLVPYYDHFDQFLEPLAIKLTNFIFEHTNEQSLVNYTLSCISEILLKNPKLFDLLYEKLRYTFQVMEKKLNEASLISLEGQINLVRAIIAANHEDEGFITAFYKDIVLPVLKRINPRTSKLDLSVLCSYITFIGFMLDLAKQSNGLKEVRTFLHFELRGNLNAFLNHPYYLLNDKIRVNIKNIIITCNRIL